MQPKIMNSLKSELQKMAAAGEQKLNRGTLEGKQTFINKFYY